MKTCLIVDDSGIIRKVARRILGVSSFRFSKPRTASKRSTPASANCPMRYCWIGICRKWTAMISCGRYGVFPAARGPKVVFCTTENDVAHIARALQAGADEYIMKPFDKDIVEEKFQEVGLI
jgi:two-component system chemotaxis response regulator CheY